MHICQLTHRLHKQCLNSNMQLIRIAFDELKLRIISLCFSAQAIKSKWNGLTISLKQLNGNNFKMYDIHMKRIKVKSLLNDCATTTNVLLSVYAITRAANFVLCARLEERWIHFHDFRCYPKIKRKRCFNSLRWRVV